MEREVLERMVLEDQKSGLGLLDINKKSNWRIYGRINGKRGGAFQGFDDDGVPIFGGSNLIYAPVWWNKSFSEVQEICEKILSKYPDCQALPDEIGQ